MSLTFKVFILILSFLLSIQNAHALAIAQPMPSNVTLKRGESLPFRFNVQAVTSKQDQRCTYSMSGLNSLIVTFEKEEVLVEAGSELNVFGSLGIPKKASVKEYQGELIVICRPNIEASGVSLITQSTRFPFYVRVEKTEEEGGLDWKYLLVFFIVVIIIVVFITVRSKHGLKIEENKNKSHENR